MYSLTELADKHFSDKGTFKHNYTKVYQRFLEKLRKDKINLLEIGVAEGGSCMMWLDYFANGKIFGADYYSRDDLKKYYLLNPYISNSADSKNKLISRMDKVFNHERFYFLQLDQSKAKELEGIDQNFDVIIDDGSHIHGDIQLTFGTLAPKVKKGGFYFIEDLNCKRSFSNPGRSKSSLKDKLNFATLSKIYTRDTRALLADLKFKGVFKSLFLDSEQTNFIERNFSVETIESISSGTIACLKRI